MPAPWRGQYTDGDRRYTRWLNPYTPGDEARTGQIVSEDGSLYVANKPTTDPASASSEDWDLMSESGYDRVLAGYGGVGLDTPTAITIDTGWKTIPADKVIYTTPVNVTQDVANDGVAPEIPGPWLVTGYLSISHDTSIPSRELFIRLYNVTQASPGPVTTFYVGRNQDGTNVSFAVPSESSVVDDLVVVQIGGTSSIFTGATVDDYNFAITHIASTGGGGSGGGGDPDFAGAGTRGYVPDPGTETGKVLDDSGNWVAPGGGSSTTQAASFNSSGSLVWSSEPGWSANKTAAGIYTVTFPTAASSQLNQSVTANTAITGTTAASSVTTDQFLTTSCRVRISNSGGTAYDLGFSVQRIVG